jgi:hypothetical protein
LRSKSKFAISILVFSCTLTALSYQAVAATRYAVDCDTVRNGNYIPTPQEFKNGTATLQDIKDWSSSYLLCETDKATLPAFEFMNQDSNPEKLVLAKMSVAKHPKYFVFEKTATGYKYIGDLQGNSFYRFAYPHAYNPYKLTTGIRYVADCEARVKDGLSIPIPHEFQNGTATLQDAKDWASSYLSCDKDEVEESKLEFMTPDSSPEKIVMAMVDSASNSTYFVFKNIMTGYKYVGDLSGSSFYKLYYPQTKNAYILTTWHVGGGETTLHLTQIHDDKLQGVGRAIVWNGEKIYLMDEKGHNKETPELAKFAKIDLFEKDFFDRLVDNRIAEQDLQQIFDLKRKSII